MAIPESITSKFRGKLAFSSLRFSPMCDLVLKYQIPLPPELLRAVPKRQAEFIAGRHCAATALMELTGDCPPIPIRPDRSPHWPAGVVGSISHTNRQAMAVVGPAYDFAGIGIDCEQIVEEDRAQSLAESIFAPGDFSFQPATMAFATFLILVFSAKESLYKALYPQAGLNLDFQHVHLAHIDDTVIRLALSPTCHKKRTQPPYFDVCYWFDDDENIATTLLALQRST